MQNEFYNYVQYDSCISRGICSINPRISALQTVLVLYLRIFAKYATKLNIDQEIENFILNTLSITIYNPEFNEKSFLYAVKKFKVILPEIMKEFSESNLDIDMSLEKEKADQLFQETEDIIQSIKFGEYIFKRGLEKIPNKIRDLYNIMLVIAKSISINLLELKSFDKEYKNAFKTVLDLLSQINIEEKDFELLKNNIYQAAKTDCELMKILRNAQEDRYGKSNIAEVSYTTVPNKAVLVVGSNIRELEIILESLKTEDIDVYTHDDMMFAHTFPKFSEYPNLKGQFGQGLENCLLDFATFPGPIILTKQSLHNIENFYRGRLFTTDYTTSPQGIIKIENNDFSEVIKSANESKGFKTGKTCETIKIGYDYDYTTKLIKEKLASNNYDHVFLIGLDNYSLEQKVYFEKIIKLAPKNVLIISFSYDIEKDNLVYINTCFDNFSWLNIFEYINSFGLKSTVFIPKCNRNSISQIVYISAIKNTKIYVGKCTPIILNPSLIDTLKSTFKVESISNSRKDLEEIFKDK